MAELFKTLFIDNPLSQKIIVTSKKILFKDGNSATINAGIKQSLSTAAQPVVMSLYQQGGRASSVFIRLAGLSGATAVVLGAYGAHKADWPITEDTKRDPKAVWEVANRYHFYNSLALIAVPLVKRPWLTGSLMITGVILFSGTCYYSACTGDQRFNRLAPLGGTSLILAWLSMMFF